jgi:site-specific DNA-cytosine methylase
VDKDVAPTLRDHTRPTSNGDGGVIAFAWQQGDDSKFNKSGRGRSWLVRAGDYAGSVQAQRVDAVSIPAETTHTLKAEGADASEDGTGRGVPMVLEIAAPLTHGSFDKSHTPGRRMEDDVNLVVEDRVAIYRKSKRAQTEVDDETWVESDETNTQNAFDVGDARATELIVKPFTVHGEHSTAMTGGGDADVAFPTDTARSLDTNGGYSTNQGGNVVEELAQPLRTNIYNNSDPGMEAKMHVIQPGEAPPLRGFGHGWQGQHNDDVARAGIVRRLTVTECERLQAFPDGWTCLEVDYITHPDIEGPYLGFPDGTPYSTEECSCPDGPRYRALGNAVTTNAAFWVVQRLVRWIEFSEAAADIAKWVVADWLKEQTA